MLFLIQKYRLFILDIFRIFLISAIVTWKILQKEFFLLKSWELFSLAEHFIYFFNGHVGYLLVSRLEAI